MKQKIKLLAIVALSLSIFGCKSNVESELIGRWRQMQFIPEENETRTIRWSFETNNTIIIKVFNKEDQLIDSVTAEYSTTRKKLKNRVEINRSDNKRIDVEQIDYRGIYRVEQLSRKTLRLLRVATYAPDGSVSENGRAFLNLELLKE